MKFDYYADANSLYIDLSNHPSAESEEVAPLHCGLWEQLPVPKGRCGQ